VLGQRGALEPFSTHIANAVAAAAALIGLIVALGPISGGHFNPLITWLQSSTLSVVYERDARVVR
jgi:glycerol uptake facilitator-like aquaporin